jgi:hypothetical protein
MKNTKTTITEAALIIAAIHQRGWPLTLQPWMANQIASQYNLTLTYDRPVSVGELALAIAKAGDPK